jgi:hypothetical protein
MPDQVRHDRLFRASQWLLHVNAKTSGLSQPVI